MRYLLGPIPSRVLDRASIIFLIVGVMFFYLTLRKLFYHITV
jgi:hypothetical protein